MCFSGKDGGTRPSTPARIAQTLHIRPGQEATSSGEKSSVPARNPTGRRTAGATARLNDTKFRRDAEGGKGSSFDDGRGDGAPLRGAGGPSSFNDHNQQSGGLYGGVNGGVHGGVYGGGNGGVTGGVYGGVYGTSAGGGYVGQGMGGGGHSSTGGGDWN